MSYLKVVVRNTTYLTIAQLVAYVVPLLEVPILARALGPEAYGQIVVVQSVALMASIVVEYGFNLSSARDVAKNSGDKKRLAQLFSDVLAAKLLLMAGVSAMLVGGIWFTSISMRGVPASHIILGVLYFLAFAFSPFWFFLGKEKIGGITLLELCLRLICLFMLYIFIKKPEDATLALALLASTSLTNTFVTNALCVKYLPIVRPRISGAIGVIRSGFNVFVYRSANTVLVTAAPALIGACAGRTATGVFVPAEKVVRAVVGLFTPVFTAAFPHFARSLAIGDIRSRDTAWFVVAASATLGLCGATFLYLFGAPLLLFAVGKEFTATIELLKWFVWLIPLRIFNQALGLLMLIPSGKDRQTSRAIIFFSFMSLLVGVLLLERCGALGMVASLLVSELGLAGALLFIAIKKRPYYIMPSDKK